MTTIASQPSEFHQQTSSKFQLFVKIQNGKTIIVDVPNKATVNVIKSLIFKKEGIPIQKQRLIFNTKELSNELSLSIYGINDESSLLLNLKMGGGVLVVVKTLEGSSVEIEVDEDDTVETLKQKIYEKQGISVENQRLIFERKKLDDHKTLADYNMKEHSAIHLVKAAAK